MWLHGTSSSLSLPTGTFMRFLVPLLLSFVAAFHVQAQVTITPLAPTPSDVIFVQVLLDSYEVRSQSHSVSGDTVTVTIVNKWY